MTSAYIHIPFCVKKCVYCDFLSFEFSTAKSAKTADEHGAYVRALINEIRVADFSETKIDTVYIGGGTPTALPSYFLCEIIRCVKELPLLPNAEITVEANPGTLDAEYLYALKENGVTRLSIGLQSTHEDLLRTIGRIHMKEEFTKNFRAARKAGFDNISVDLMFSLPRQTMRQWYETLSEVIALSPEHISAYSLTPAEKTPLWTQIENGEVILPDEKTDREMYHEARKILMQAGYVHYEISNFAKPNRESRHNINCWTMKPYIGFGLGAHSFDGTARWHNAENINDYIEENRRNPLNKTILSEADLSAEKMILGLRLMRGVTPLEKYKDEIEKLIKNGLLIREENRILLSEKGLDLANHVFLEFV
jgi:oxygen-independent coproporphyrinogen-3 oxidase